MERQEDELSHKIILTQKSDLDLENSLSENNKPLDKINSNMDPELSENKPQSLTESSEAKQDISLLSHRHAKRAFGDEFIINQFTVETQSLPSVACLTNGNV